MVLVDEEDYEWMSMLTFQGHKRGRTVYAKATFVIDGKRTKVAMHRLIMEWYMGPLGDQEIDHWNGHGWDNRKENLRVVDRCANTRNRRKCLQKTSSQYKGVFKDGETYRVIINRNNLGHYVDERDAAIVYNLSAQELFGEYAALNDVGMTAEDEIRVRALMNNPKRRHARNGPYSSLYRGVSVSHGKAWRAAIYVNGKSVKLGSFSTEEAAARAYNEAALKQFGSKARLNVIPHV